METWQIDHINSHLPKLLANTICSNTFLATLQSKQILSSEDNDLIQSEKARIDKASLLYKIILTRKNSYDILLSALIETKQSGAHFILNASFVEFNRIIDLEYQKEKRLGKTSGNGDFVFYAGKFGNRHTAVRRERYLANSESATTRIKQEITLLTKLDCQKNIVRYFTCKIDDDLQHILLVFELCSSTLENLICGENQQLPKHSKISILKQLTSALRFLHSQNLIYLNIRPSSILISNDLPCKLRPKFSNFRSATYSSPDGISNVASEILWKNRDWLPGSIQLSLSDNLKEINVDPTADIFSLGCLFHFVLFSKHPFGNLFFRNVSMITNAPYKYPENEPICNKLIQKMITRDESAKLSLDDVISFLNTQIQG